MSALERLEASLTAAIPLSVYRAVLPREVIGLVYHTVSAGRLPHVSPLYPFKTPAQFARDLDLLRDRFSVVAYPDLPARGGASTRRQAAILTFDDGYAECHTVVRPLLQERGLPGTFFIATDFVDNRRMFYRNQIALCLAALDERQGEEIAELLPRLEAALGAPVPDAAEARARVRAIPPEATGALEAVLEILHIDVRAYLATREPYLTRAQIRELAREGFTVGAHSRSHVKFNRLSPEAQAAEIVESCRAVQEMTGQAEVPFAFPFSGAGVDLRALDRVRRRHPVVGALFDARGVHPGPWAHDRVWADPPPMGPDESNLLKLIHEAFQAYALWRRRYLTGVLAARLRGR